MNVAQIWSRKKNDTLAIYALDRLITNYPRSFLTPDAYIQLANTHSNLVRGPYYDQSNTEDAITFFEDFLIQFREQSRQRGGRRIVGYAKPNGAKQSEDRRFLFSQAFQFPRDKSSTKLSRSPTSGSAMARTSSI